LLDTIVFIAEFTLSCKPGFFNGKTPIFSASIVSYWAWKKSHKFVIESVGCRSPPLCFVFSQKSKRDVVLLVLSPEEVYERKMSNQELYAAINNLPEKQAKRLYAHFFLDMNIAQIARIERVGKSRVSHSINQALKNLEKFLKNN
jgi:DNA-directed RNA polymerase specialized sigma24 family protein